MTIASLMATLQAAAERQKSITAPTTAPEDGETAVRVVREAVQPQAQPQPPERIAKLDISP
jgi:hypothetical protein